jgi:hypothetical protein
MAPPPPPPAAPASEAAPAYSSPGSTVPPPPPAAPVTPPAPPAPPPPAPPPAVGETPPGPVTPPGPAAPPPAPAAPTLAPAPAPTAEDPHAVGGCFGRLGFTAKRNARVAAGILTAILDEGELAQQLVQGSYLGKNAVVVLTDRRLVLVNDREWKPDIRSIGLTSALAVDGIGDDRSATLTFSGVGEAAEVIAVDASHAREFAHRVRSRIADL